MDEIIAILILLALAIPLIALILAIVALARGGDHRAQIMRLSRKVDHLERTLRNPQQPHPPSTTPLKSGDASGGLVPERDPTATSQLAESKRKRTTTAPSEQTTPQPTPSDVPPPLPERDDLVQQLVTPDAPNAPVEPADAVEDDERESLLGTELITERSAPTSSIPTAPPVKPKPKKAPRKPISFEELLSTKVIVWVAAVAVAMSGVFLVRYFVQQGLLTDNLKIGLAFALGLAFITAGEFARKMRYGMIGQGLVASGIPVLYAAVFGGTQLYALPWMPMPLAFALLAVITVAAVFLSLRHGPLVAVLGLIGGFLMPALIGAHHESAAVLFGYLFILQIALLALSRSRQWAWLTVLALLGGLFWAGGWIMWAESIGALEQRGWVAMFLLSTVVAFVASTWKDDDDRDSDKTSGGDMATLIGWLAVPAALIMSAILVRVGAFTNLDWAQLGLMSAAAIVMARLRSRYMPMPWIGAGIVGLLLIVWANMHGDAGIEFQSGRFLTIVGAFGVLYAGGAYACLWKSDRAGVWAYLSAIAGVGYGAIAYVFVDPQTLGGPWWVWTAIGAGLYAALAIPMGARRAEMGVQGDRAMAGMIIASTFLAWAALWMGVENFEGHPGLLAIFWSGLIPVVALLAVRYKLADLHIATGAVALAVAARLLLNPNVFTYPIGETPVWNWLLAGYGIPCIAFALTAWILRKHDDKTVRGMYEAGAAIIGFAMASLMVRHGFHPTKAGDGGFGLYEVSTYATTWGGLAVVLAMLGAKLDRDVLRGAAVLSGIAMIVVMLIPLFGLNPIAQPIDVGDTVVFNGLLYIYGVPALLAVAMGTMVARVDKGAAPGRILQMAGCVFGFAMVSLMVRHGFDRGFDLVRVSVFEWGTYAAVWGGISVALGAVALFGKRPTIAGLSLVMLALSLGATFLGPVLVVNPLFHQTDVGATRVFNWLLYLYGLPVIIALASARLIHHRGGQRAAVVASGLCGLALAFVLVTLQVRHAFLGPILEGPWPTDAEGYAYSAAWIGFALVLLAAALLWRSPIQTALRWSSLAVMLIAVGKVFLYDTRELDDLWRVMSFLGLGVTLFAVAWVYQRYVFARRDGDEDGEAVESDDPEAIEA